MSKAGVKEPSACVSRVLARAAKRNRVDYAGLDCRPRKKKRQAEQNRDSAETVTLSKRQQSAASGGLTTVASAVADHEIRAVAAGATEPAVTAANCGSNLVPSPKRSSTEGNIAPECPTISKAAISTNTQLPTGTDLVDAHSFVSSVPEFFGSAAGLKALETVLQHCVEVNLKLGKYKSGDVTATTRIKSIQRYASDMAELTFDAAVYAAKKSRAMQASQDVQVRFNETFYWDIITKRAKYLSMSSLKNRGGPSDEFTLAEKDTTRIFMDQLGIGTSPENQRVLRRVWKRLSDMRRAGVDKILFYRTRDFDKICEENPKHVTIPLEERVSAWEKVYGPYIAALETRALEEARGHPTERLWLTKKYVVERLSKISEKAWTGARGGWRSDEEQAAFHSTSNLTASSEQMGGMFDLCIGAGACRNKSLYVTLVPHDESFLTVCSIITIHKGDFLGVFAGYLRYSEDFDNMYGIRGPTEKLWLDYSRVTGVMNQMKVTAPGNDANVALQWELMDGDTELPRMWRVAVRAVRDIRPFEGFVRVAGQEAQYRLHRRSSCARLGFTKSVEAEEGHSAGFEKK